MHDNKQRLRRHIKTLLPPLNKAALDERIAQHVKSLLCGQLNMAAFAARSDEPDILGYLPKPVLLPVLSPQQDERLMGFAIAEGILKANRFGVLEPMGAWVKPAVILVPGLAFGRDGTRLGRGKGFYDATLAALKQENPNLQIIGVCYACQLLETVPTDLHDQRMDVVICEDGVIEV